MASLGTVRLGKAGHGKDWRGSAGTDRQGWARHGRARQSTAGKAGQELAGSGVARLARRGSMRVGELDMDDFNAAITAFHEKFTVREGDGDE